MPDFTIKWLKKINATCGAEVFDDEIALVNFIYQSLMKMMSCYLLVVFGNRPNISMAINCKGPLAANSFRWRFCLRQPLGFPH